MIFVSSSCVKHKKIKDAILELIKHGFCNIELSGGTEYYDGLADDLIELKEKYNLNYICHNYFPPPKEHFVLNLASLNNEIYEKTLKHLKNSIDLSKMIGAKKFGFHAGFFIDIKVSEIGKKISKNKPFDKEKAIERFCQGFNDLKFYTNKIELYIENNVFSSINAKTYNNENFFMLTSYKEYKELKEKIDFNILLDIAHLKVSCKTLGLEFKQEFDAFSKVSDYWHISDNDSLSDQNRSLLKETVNLILKSDYKPNIATLEIYETADTIMNNYKILSKAFCAK